MSNGRKRNSIKKPFEEYDRKTRRRFLKIVKSGEIPDELKETKEGRLIQEAIINRRMMKSGWGLFTDFIKTHKARYAGGITSTIIVNLLAIVTPIITAEIVDMLNTVEAGGESAVLDRLLILCLILVVVAVVKLVATFLVRYWILGASIVMEYMMRRKMFNKLLDLSLNYFNRKSAGEIMALSTNDLRSFRIHIPYS